MFKTMIFLVLTWKFSIAAKTCDFKLCNNEGECSLDTNNQPNCKCFGTTFFSGAKCNEEINNCQPNPCKNGATCQNYLGHYNCKCPPSFGGQHCAIKKDNVLTGFHLHYNRLAELGKAQTFLLTFETPGENNILQLYADNLNIESFFYSKTATQLKSSGNLSELARSLGLNHAERIPYDKGFHRICKGTFWQTGNQQLHVTIGDFQGKLLYEDEKMWVHVYRPKSMACVPEVDILNCDILQPSLHVDVTQFNVLTPTVKKRCARESTMKFKWTLRNSLGNVEFHNFGVSEVDILKIRPYEMSFTNEDSYEKKYLIRADVTERHEEKTFKGVALCYIETDAKPVRAIITGGLVRAAGAKQPCILDGSHSRDFYFAPKGNQHLKFKWNCTSKDDGNNGYCKNLKHFGAKLIVPANKLQSEKSYTFSLTVDSSVNFGATGSHTIEQTIQVTDGSRFYIYMKCVHNCDKDQFVAGQIVHLKAICLNCDKSEASSKYSWTLNGATPSNIGSTNRARFIFTPSEADTLITVQLQLMQGAQRGTSQLKLTKNRPPSGGSCTIAPTSGIAFETEFKIDCVGYQDDDTPLRYEYRAPQMILERCRKGSVKLRLPVLSAVEISICDAYSACAKFQLAVAVSEIKIPQDKAALLKLLQNENTNLRQFIRDDEVRKAMALTSIILTQTPTLAVAQLVLEHLSNLKLLTLLEAEQFTTITTALMRGLKPLENRKATALAKYFRKMSTGYRYILKDGEVRELQTKSYKLLTQELTETLKEFSEPLEAIGEVHSTFVQQETDYLLAEQYPNFTKFDVTVLPRIENWLEAAVELDKCIKMLGHMATNMHEPEEEALLVRSGDFTMEVFAIEGTTKRNITTKDASASIQLSSNVISELKGQLKSQNLLLQLVSTTEKTPYWWHPNEHRPSTGVLYLSIFSRELQATASVYNEIQFENPVELSMRLHEPKQSPRKLFKGYVGTPLDMPIFQMFMPADSMLIVEFQSAPIKLRAMLRLGKRPRGYMVKKSATLISRDPTQAESLTLINDSKQPCLGYLAVLSADSDINNRTNFTFIATLLDCLSWNFLVPDPDWLTNGCVPTGIANGMLHCHCYHLSTFAGRVTPAMTQAALRERQLLEYMPINWAMVIFYLLLAVFLCLLLWRVWRNSHSNACAIVEIKDSDYKKDLDIVVRFHTGGQWNAGTTANLQFGLVTRKNGWKMFTIYQDPNAPNFTTNSTCTVHLPITTRELYSDPLRISINHDGAGRYPSWYCSAIEIEDLKLDKLFYFNIEQWISNTASTFVSTETVTATKTSLVKSKFENLFINWFGCQAFLGPWRCGTNQLNRSERTMIWIIKISISVCIVACYYGRTSLETYEEEREKYYNFNINLLELFALSCVCYITGALVQILLIYLVVKY